VSRKRVLRKTKVIATIGPASDAPETIQALVRAGMNVARLNFSHGTHEEHRKRLEAVRQAAQELRANVGIMLDTKGAEIRTGRLEGGGTTLTAGGSFTLYTDGRMGDAGGVSVTATELPDELSPGALVLLDDGVIELQVTAVEPGAVRCEVRRGGRLGDHKGVNLPGESIARRRVPSQNRDDLLFAVEHDVEYIAASFVRNADEVLEIRQLLDERGARIPIIAKIENRDAVENLDEIVAVANGTMVARGDLGVEIPLQTLPMVQKKIIHTTVTNGKPVITATQMLDSMQRMPTPTRAEVSDVANAILDGTSAVMLSAETAVGAYPVEAVRTMAAIALEAEASLARYGHLQNILPEPANVVTEAVSQAAITMAHHLQAGALIALTESGFTARSISKYRPDCPIIAVSRWSDVVRRLSMNWGVTAVLAEGDPSDDDKIAYGIQRGRELGCIQPGDVVVVTGGIQQQTGSTNMIRVATVEDG